MQYIDFIGVPIPVMHPLFSGDRGLLAKIKQVEGYIELREDIKYAKEAIIPLQRSLNTDNEEKIHQLLRSYPYQLPEIILSYIIMIYAKSFVKATGRPNLKNAEKKIFENDLNKHELIMSLRHKFFAHQELVANKHQLFCLQNTPSIGQVRMNPDSQRIRTDMASSINISVLIFCIEKVISYLNNAINGLCEKIEGTLNEKQLTFINSTPKADLRNEYWSEQPQHRVSPFKSRKNL